MLNSELRIEEEFKRKQERLMEMRERQMEAAMKASLLRHKESDAMEMVMEEMGIDRYDRNGQLRDMDEVRRLIEVKRMFNRE